MVVSRQQLSSSDELIVVRGLETFVVAGVPVERAFGAIARTVPPGMAERVRNAHAMLREGSSVATALSRSGIASPAIAGLIRSGERGSGLASALASASTELEWRGELSASVRGALIYPMILVFAGGASLFLIVGIVIPRFAAILEDIGQRLPASTRFVLATSRIVHDTAIPAMIAVIATLIAVMLWHETKHGKLWLHERALSLPLIGGLRLSLSGARFCRNLGALLGAGAPLIAAIDGAKLSVTDHAIAARIDRARHHVMEGSSLSEALRRTRAVSPALLQMVAVGEGSGQLPQILKRGGDAEIAEFRTRMSRLLRAAEPLTILLLAVVIGLIAASMLQAVYSIRPGY